MHGVASVLALVIAFIERRGRRMKEQRKQEEERLRAARKQLDRFEGSDDLADHSDTMLSSDVLEPPVVPHKVDSNLDSDGSMRNDSSRTRKSAFDHLDIETRDLVSELEVTLLERELDLARRRRFSVREYPDDDPRKLLDMAMKAIEVAQVNVGKKHR